MCAEVFEEAGINLQEAPRSLLGRVSRHTNLEHGLENWSDHNTILSLHVLCSSTGGVCHEK